MLGDLFFKRHLLPFPSCPGCQLIAEQPPVAHIRCRGLFPTGCAHDASHLKPMCVLSLPLDSFCSWDYQEFHLFVSADMHSLNNFSSLEFGKKGRPWSHCNQILVFSFCCFIIFKRCALEISAFLTVIFIRLSKIRFVNLYRVSSFPR